MYGAHMGSFSWENFFETEKWKSSKSQDKAQVEEGWMDRLLECEMWNYGMENLWHGIVWLGILLLAVYEINPWVFFRVAEKERMRNGNNSFISHKREISEIEGERLLEKLIFIIVTVITKQTCLLFFFST